MDLLKKSPNVVITKIQNFIEIQSSRFRWYSFVFAKTQSSSFWSIFCGQKVNFEWPIRPTGLLVSLGMELLWDDINQISKDSFGWIALKVIFQGRRGQIWLFWHLKAICSNCSVTFLYFCIELPRKGTNELPKDWFAWIALKVFFKVGKVRSSFIGVILILYSNINDVHQVIFKVRKFGFGPLWSICTNI